MKVIVIGSGFSGLAAATSLADKGHEVVIIFVDGDTDRDLSSGDWFGSSRSYLYGCVKSDITS